MESEKAPVGEPIRHELSSPRSSSDNNDPPTPLKHETTVTDAHAEAASRVKSADGVHDFLTGWKLFLALSSVTVVMLLAMLDMAIIGTAIPQITSDFNRLEDVGWYIGSYQLASATLQPLTGKMFTYFKSKVCDPFSGTTPLVSHMFSGPSCSSFSFSRSAPPSVVQLSIPTCSSPVVLSLV